MIARSACRNVSSTISRWAWLSDTHSVDPPTTDPLTLESAWIAANADAQKIRCVFHSGDFTQNNMAVAAASGFKELSVPLAFCRGNHDFSNLSTRLSSTFDSLFPPSLMSGLQAKRVGNQSSDMWAKYQLTPGMDWGVMVLDFGAADVSLTWAAGIIDANPTLPWVVLTHSYMHHDGTRYNGQTYDPHEYFDPLEVECNNGEEMWTKLIRDRGNIGFVLSGHDWYATAYLSSARSGGGHMFTKCHQFLSNWQGLSGSYGGNPNITMLGIDLTNNLLELSVFSPSTLLNNVQPTGARLTTIF